MLLSMLSSLVNICDIKLIMLLHFIIEFIKYHVFHITFITDVIIICLSSFSYSLIKFASKCYVVLLVNISGILNESFVEFTFNLT